MVTSAPSVELIPPPLTPEFPKTVKLSKVAVPPEIQIPPASLFVELPEIVEPTDAYVANMRALWEGALALAQAVELVDESELAELEATRSGAVTCKVSGAGGEGVYVHSRYDPEREAARWAEGAIAQGAAMEDREQGRVPMCYIVDGFGLGYHVKALYERLTGEAFIVVSEPEVGLIRTAVEHLDYSEMFASGRVIVITKPDRQEIFNKLESHGQAMMLGTVYTKALHRGQGEFHRTVHQLVNEYASYMRTMLISIISQTP